MESLKRVLQSAPNAAVGWIIRQVGWSPAGAELLEVRGRRSGKIHAVPVNPIEVNGKRYLFAPRGVPQWVRNFRVAKEGALGVGDKLAPIVMVRELPDDEKPEIIRAYLDRWHWQVGSLVGVPKDATDEQLATIAPNHPIFEIANANQQT